MILTRSSWKKLLSRRVSGLQIPPKSPQKTLRNIFIIIYCGGFWIKSLGSGPIMQNFALSWAAVDNSKRQLLLGARLRGRTATQRSKKGSEKILGRVLGKGSQKGSEKGACYGFYCKNGLWEGFAEWVLRRGFPKGAWNAPLESTPP